MRKFVSLAIVVFLTLMLLTSLTGVLAQTPNPAWKIRTVDNGVGSDCSLALDSNDNPHLIYTTETELGNSLFYASWNGTGWNIQTVAPDALRRISLALDSFANPHICYSFYTTNKMTLRSTDFLNYANWNGSTWNIQTVDTAQASMASSIAVDSEDNPHISYYYYVPGTNGKGFLKYASLSSTGWNLESVDSASIFNPNYVSVALDPQDRPHISFSSTEIVLYASWAGSSWSKQTVEQGSDYSRTVLALDSHGNPLILYMEGLDNNLFYARWNGAGFSTQSTNITQAYIGNSFALDSAGILHITYYDHKNNVLNYAYTMFSPNSTPWTIVGAVLAAGIILVVAIVVVLRFIKKKKNIKPSSPL